MGNPPNRGRKAQVKPRARAAPRKRRAPRPNNNNRRNLRPGNELFGAQVNTPSNYKMHPTKRIVSKITDELFTVNLPLPMLTGQIIFDELITCELTQRLRQQANIYQFAKFKKITFHIQTQTASVLNGGYRVAFLDDPSSTIGSGNEALRALLAVTNAQVTKSWQSSTFTVTPKQREYYVKPTGETRLYSPGRIVMITDGEITAPTTSQAILSLTVAVDFHMEFNTPIISQEINTIPYTTLLASCIISNTGITGNNVVVAKNWAMGETPEEIHSGPDVPWNQALSSLPTLAALTNDPLMLRMPEPFYNKRTNDLYVARFLKVSNIGNQYVVTQHSLPDGSDTETYGNDANLLMHWQGDIFTAIAPSEFLGTASTRGFWLALQSPSVRGQSRFSKKFQSLPLSDSKRMPTATQTDLAKLSMKFGTSLSQ